MWGQLIRSAQGRGCLHEAASIPALKQVVKACHQAHKRQGEIATPGNSLFRDKTWEVCVWREPAGVLLLLCSRVCACQECCECAVGVL